LMEIAHRLDGVRYKFALLLKMEKLLRHLHCNHQMEIRDQKVFQIKQFLIWCKKL
jgi:hypothetical protein